MPYTRRFDTAIHRRPIEDDVASMTICEDCGAIVRENIQPIHTEWHAKIDEIFSSIWERLNEGDL